MTAVTYLFLSLPFLLSLATSGANPKVLGFVSSGFAILLNVESGGAVLPWATGMTVVAVALYERFGRQPA
jgi:threonine/homoserine/homoserine lactone efflux protein